MVPLEVSHTALVTPDIVQRIEKFHSLFGNMMVELLNFFAKSYKEVFKFPFPPLHDPLAVAYAINPSIFETELMRVDIETSSTFCKYATC
jgi:inosine-uridine nucleoside N-ribohydrolase